MDFGHKIIETERLLLRKLTADDASGVFDGYGDELAMKYWSHVAFTDIKQAQKLIENELKWWDAGRAVRMAIILKDGQNFAGSICMHSFDEMCRRGEIGYLLNRKYWQQGIMSEALNAMIGYAFGELGLNRLEADIDPENKASAALLLKAGFKREGLLRERWIVAGVKSDSEIYGILAGDV